MRIGIIGTGWVAEKHLHALSQIETAEVVAIAGRNQARAHELAAPFQAQTYPDYLPMLEQQSLDAVFILLPPHLHGDVERACAEHCPAVLLEKPIGLSIEQAQNTLDDFERAGTCVSVGYMNRYRASVQHARSVFTAAPPAILANGWWVTQMPPPQWWRRIEQSGGQFVEQCTHLVDLSRYLMGEIIEVSAYRAKGFMTEVPNYNVDDAMIVNARFASGAIGAFQTACFPQGEFGDSGISLHFASLQDRIELKTWDFVGSHFKGDGSSAQELPNKEDPFLSQNRAFLSQASGQTPNSILSNYSDAQQTLAVTLAANQSAQAGGTPVSITDLLPR